MYCLSTPDPNEPALIAVTVIVVPLTDAVSTAAVSLPGRVQRCHEAVVSWSMRTNCPTEKLVVLATWMDISRGLALAVRLVELAELPMAPHRPRSREGPTTMAGEELATVDIPDCNVPELTDADTDIL